MECTVVRTLENGAKIEDCGDMIGGEVDVDTTVQLMNQYGWADSTAQEIVKIDEQNKSEHPRDFEQIKYVYFR